ncbi:hypothetical protein [Streptomyces sp. NPDC017991]|uniref:hypothetical protein n=1 Tax=Streptomyces sp. NPDC017991 TaxID=3365026 RepID=UPI00379ED95E
MNATTPAGPAEQGRGLQPPAFALIARADRGYACFLTTTVPAAPSAPRGGDRDDAARQR